MHVKIFSPAKNAMQSGFGKTGQWKIAFDQAAPSFIDPLMGWNGMRDTQQELNLLFSSQEDAVAYAKKHGYSYTIEAKHERKIAPKSYAANFATRREMPF